MADDAVRRGVSDHVRGYHDEVDADLLQLAMLVGTAVYFLGSAYKRFRSRRKPGSDHLRPV